MFAASLPTGEGFLSCAFLSFRRQQATALRECMFLDNTSSVSQRLPPSPTGEGIGNGKFVAYEKTLAYDKFFITSKTKAD